MKFDAEAKVFLRGPTRSRPFDVGQVYTINGWRFAVVGVDLDDRLVLEPVGPAKDRRRPNRARRP